MPRSGSIKRGNMPCPRCRASGRSPFNHDHGWGRLDAIGLNRELEVLKRWAKCSLCNGKKFLAKAQISAFNGGRPE